MKSKQIQKNRLYSIAELAFLLGVSEHSVFQLVREEAIRSSSVNPGRGRRYFLGQDILDFYDKFATGGQK